MKCAYCGKELPPDCRKGRLYCSDTCRANASYHRHSQDRKRAAREHYHEKLGQEPKEVQIVKCARCGETFLQPRADQIFCSKNCRRLAHNERRRKNLDATCAICGKPFHVAPFGRRKYCSEACAKQAEAEQRASWNKIRNERRRVIRQKYREAHKTDITPIAGNEITKAASTDIPQFQTETRPWILENRQPNQAEIDALLDKIFKQGAQS